MVRPTKPSIQNSIKEKPIKLLLTFPVTKDLHLNGRAQLNLRIKSSTNKGLLSAQLLEHGQKKYLQPYPAVLSARTIDTVATTCWKISVNCHLDQMNSES